MSLGAKNKDNSEAVEEIDALRKIARTEARSSEATAKEDGIQRPSYLADKASVTTDPSAEIRRHLDQTTRRLNYHIDRLKSFAIGNLVIGSLIAAAGIGVILVLFNQIFAMDFVQMNSMSNGTYISFFVMVFLPRISIVILIQIFAYFFLSMYRANLREIRYFQMEMNDLELVSAALEIGRQAVLTKHQGVLIEKLFALSKYRGDAFRSSIASDEAIETFKELSASGNILDNIGAGSAGRVNSRLKIKDKLSSKTEEFPSQSYFEGDKMSSKISSDI